MTASYPRLLKRYQGIAVNADYRLFGHPRLTMAQQLSAIGEEAACYEQQDYYGEGELIESFEAEIATLLGKEAAVFLPSGTMAQCIALRIWSERAGTECVGFHATSHLELHEEKAYRTLHGLRGLLVGEPDRPISLADLQAIKEPLAAVLLELPMREIGGQLPSWEALRAQSAWLREQGIALHMDGARLWQCDEYFKHSMAETAALFDSVYLSFYKDVGGIAGSTLAGSESFIGDARSWIRRAGGNLYSLFPYVLAARAGMKRNLPGMPDAIKAAAWLAEHLNGYGQLQTTPQVPPTNLFHLKLPYAPPHLLNHACDWSEQHGVLLLSTPRSVESQDDCSTVEYSLGRGVSQASPAQWKEWLADFFPGIVKEQSLRVLSTAVRSSVDQSPG